MLDYLKMKKKLKVGVLMGGLSEEHEVSLATGQNVMENLDKSKYQPIAIKLSRTPHQVDPLTAIKKGSGLGAGQVIKWFLNGKLTTMEKALKSCDLVFNALHGSFGEDGKVQAIMEYHGVRYTGSGICGSVLAMDKLRSREIFKLAGLSVPKTLKLRRGDNYQALLKLFVGKVTNFPVVVKPCSSGSSVGVQMVKNHVQLEKAIKETFKLDSKVLIEELIDGKEVTCGVLENFSVEGGPASGWNDKIAALPVTEIVPKRGNKFFNYKAKYTAGQCDEITPAFLDEEVTNKIKETAVKAHQLLGCKAYSRTDMILRGDDVIVLETNTLPGLTANSLLPKAAQFAGLTFAHLLDHIISNSLA